MNKFLSISLVFILSFTLVACGNSQQTKNEPEKAKIENKKIPVKTETNNKKETKITSGEIYNKIGSIEKVKYISTIEDTEIGFINLNISIDVAKGKAIEELDSYTKKVAKIQTRLSDYFVSKKFVRITYVMYVDNEIKNVITTYKKQNNKYVLENTMVLEEKYKKAADALK